MHFSIRTTHERAAGVGDSRLWTRLPNQAGEKQITVKQDRLTISGQANYLWNQYGNKTMMERLMEQKQQIVERRSQYISHAMEKGASPDAMKMELEEIDAQLEEIELQIRKLELEEQRKAAGMNTDGQKKKDDHKEILSSNTADSGQGEDSSFAINMNALVSASNEMKKISSVKMAQITLNRESKAWEHSDPVRSMTLKHKAEELNGKMLERSGDINDELRKTNDKMTNVQRHAKDNEDDPSSKPMDEHQAATELKNKQESSGYSRVPMDNATP